jgi:hypothetical protein
MSEQSGELGPQEYLGYRLIVKIKQRSRRQISRSKFLKLNCIADRFLRDELDTDIGLPRYWYKYGEIMDEQSINGEFYHAPSARGYRGQQYLTSREYDDDEFDIDEETRERINDAVEWTALRFAKRNADEIKNYQYQVQAPKEFIRAYSELRERLDVSNLEEQTVLGQFSSSEEGNKELATDLLDEMLLTYPKNEYDTIYDLYLRWDDTARLLIKNEPDFDALNEFLDEFIEALSKVELRFEHSEHVPEERMERWREERNNALDDFEATLREMRKELLRDRKPSGELDKVAEDYNETVAGLMQTKNDGE